MTDFEAVMISEGVEEVITEEMYLAAWQHIVDHELYKHLQGWFGRTAAQLIQEGKINAPTDQK